MQQFGGNLCATAKAKAARGDSVVMEVIPIGL